MKWKIGNVKIDNQVVLAPMSGVCDSSYRQIIKSMGCGLISCEMLSAKSIIHSNKKAKKMLYMTDYERPISQQIYGNDAETFELASKAIYEYAKPDIIDINMGCPVNKVAVKYKSGSALLKEPDKIYEIVHTVSKSVPIPITVKIRSGWDENTINAVENAKIIEEVGASAICVHPRHKTQGYEGTSDWSIIKKIKEKLSIPVIGNGDVKSCYDAKRMLDETSCDAVMIGRGVLGNPWLIKECVDYLEYNVEPSEVSVDERINMLKKHTELLIKNEKENVAIQKMRTHAAYYIKGLPHSVEIKEKIFKMNTKEELFELLDEYKKRLS